MTDYPLWPEEFAARYRALGHWRGETFGGVLADRARRFGDRVAVVDTTTRLTYAALERRSRRVAAGLRGAGVRRGDRVVLHLPNAVSFFEVVFGLFRLGALPVFALPAHRYAEISHLCAHTDATAYVTTDVLGGFDHRELAARLRQDHPDLTVVIDGEPGPYLALSRLRDGDAAGDHAADHDIDHDVAAADHDIDHDVAAADHDIDHDVAAADHDIDAAGGPDTDTDRGDGEDRDGPTASDVAFLQLSGGSTGLPKLIPRTHDDYLYSVRASAGICGFDEHTVYLAALPVSHNFPLSSPGVLGALYVGGRVVLAPDPSPDTALAMIAEHRVTVTAAVPPLVAVWAANASRHDLSSLRVLQVGGAAFGERAARRAVTAFGGARLQQVFGMAEGLVNYTRLDDDPELVVTTQGRPISPEDEIRIVDDADVEVEPGAPGHLLTRGPYTIRGYYRAAAHNREAFTEDGFYRTGDIVRQLPGGHLVVVGRAKDQINRGGEKIAVEEVEDHLLAHPGIRDAAVVGVPDEFLGERSVAVIIPAGEGLTGREVTSFLRDRGLAGYKIPDLVRSVDEFPLTAVGKTGKRELRRVLAENLRR